MHKCIVYPMLRVKCASWLVLWLDHERIMKIKSNVQWNGSESISPWTIITSQYCSIAHWCLFIFSSLMNTYLTHISSQIWICLPTMQWKHFQTITKVCFKLLYMHLQCCFFSFLFFFHSLFLSFLLLPVTQHDLMLLKALNLIAHLKTALLLENGSKAFYFRSPGRPRCNYRPVSVL